VARDDGLVELEVDTCIRLLERHHFGRVAVNDDRGPLVLPVNYSFEDGTVIFRTAPGTKLEAAERGEPATFEIDDVDERRRIGWSVLVRGRLAEVTDGDEIERLEAEMEKPFAPGERSHFIRVMSAAISGRRIPIPRQIPPEWFERADLGNIFYGQDATDLLG
jgi:uncharacterized protein